MKHVLGVMLLVALCSGLRAVSFRFAGGVDVAGQSMLINDAIVMGQVNKAAPTVSAQMLFGKKGITYGLGADYQFPREAAKMPYVWNSHWGKHAYTPVYGILGYRFDTATKISTELIGQMGYNFVEFDFKNLEEVFSIP